MHVHALRGGAGSSCAYTVRISFVLAGAAQHSMHVGLPEVEDTAKLPGGIQVRVHCSLAHRTWHGYPHCQQISRDTMITRGIVPDRHTDPAAKTAFACMALTQHNLSTQQPRSRSLLRAIPGASRGKSDRKAPSVQYVCRI